MTKKIAIFFFIISSGICFSQTEESTTSVNDAYKEMEAIKKAYYQNLREEQKASLYKVNQERTANSSQKISNKKLETKQRVDSLITYRQSNKQSRLALIEQKKKNLLREKQQKIDNRSANKSDEVINKKEKLIASNKEEISNRKQVIKNSKEENKSAKQLKISKRRQALLNRYSKYTKK